MGNHWNLQDAKNKFSALVDAAQKGQPQFVTKRGAEAVVVLSAEEFKRLSGLDPKPKKTFIEHILDFPKLPEGMDDIFDKREPMILEMRDIEFDE